MSILQWMSILQRAEKIPLTADPIPPDQNSEQLKIIRRWHLSLRQITLHFSCTAAAPQTGHLISFLISIAVVDRGAA
jgi:hypothetical protein